MPGGSAADAAGPRRLGTRAGRVSARSPPARCGRTRWGCASASGWPQRCFARPGCSCSTSRPTASTRKASTRSASCCCPCTRKGTTIFLSSHLLAEVEQLCTRVGVLDRGRLVLQDQLDMLQRPTGRTVVRTQDAASAHAVLDGQVERRDGDRLVVRRADASALNALLVDRACGSPRSAPERRTLEQVVLDATASADPGEPGDHRRAAQAGHPAAHLDHHRAHRRASDPGGGAAGADRHRPAAGHRTGVPVRGAHRRHAVPPGGAGDGAAAVPAGGGRADRR